MEAFKLYCFQCQSIKENVIEYKDQLLRGIPIGTDRICQDCYPLISDWVDKIKQSLQGNSPIPSKEFVKTKQFLNSWDCINKRLL